MRNLFLLASIVFISVKATAQNIGIGTTKPDNSAILDIQSNNKGILIPRTSTASRLTIPAVKGLLVYDTTTNSFWFNNGSAWVETLNGNNTSIGTERFDTSSNTAFGRFALAAVPTGMYNSGIGYFSLYTNSTGSYNTALGSQSLIVNSSGSYNTAIGEEALSGNTTASGNVAIGYKSLSLNNTGAENTALGYQSGLNNKGNFLVAIGSFSGYNNTTGSLNTFIGTSSGRSNTTGSNNTFLGVNTGFNSTGSSNTFIGTETGKNNSSGSSNTSLGFKSSFTNTTGNESTTIGFQSGFNNNSNFLVAMGSFSGFSNTTGANNTFIGTSAGRSNTSGANNTYVGTNAGFSTIGTNNTCMGMEAGKNNISGWENTAIGSGSDFTSGFLNNAVAIGANAKVACSNCLVLGGNTETTRTKVGINTDQPLVDLHLIETLTNNSGFAIEHPNGKHFTQWLDQYGGLYFFSSNVNTWAYISYTGDYIQGSDERTKKNITELNDDVLGRLMKLKPSKYLYKNQQEDESYRYGFIAQDVQKIFPDFVMKNEKGYLGVGYHNFGVIAVKAIQQQQLMIEDLKKENETLKTKFTELEKRIQQLEQPQLITLNH